MTRRAHLALALVGLGLSAAACHRASAPESSASDSGASANATEAASAAREPGSQQMDQGVELTPQEVAKLGVLTAQARSTTHERSVAGFGLVMAHEPVAQAMSEIATALAAARQSRSALERGKRLAGTPGAVPAEAQESAERQAAADEASLNLARQRLTALLGQGIHPDSSADARELSALASGRDKLVRATFPLGSLADGTPTRLRLARIDADREKSEGMVKSIWQAPSDIAVPGRSYFAVLQGSRAAEGEHLLARADTGVPESGVLIPSAAAVLSAGRFWCYVESRPGNYVRREIDTGSPIDDGYFVTSGVAAGERIVVGSAGLLLARETNPAAEAE